MYSPPNPPNDDTVVDHGRGGSTAKIHTVRVRTDDGAARKVGQRARATDSDPEIEPGNPAARLVGDDALCDIHDGVAQRDAGVCTTADRSRINDGPAVRSATWSVQCDAIRWRDGAGDRDRVLRLAGQCDANRIFAGNDGHRSLSQCSDRQE